MNPGELSNRLQLHLTSHRSVNDVSFHAALGTMGNGEDRLLVRDFRSSGGDGSHALVEPLTGVGCGGGHFDDGGWFVEQLPFWTSPFSPAFVDRRRVCRAKRRDADDVVEFFAGDTGFPVALGSTDDNSPNMGRFTETLFRG